MKEKKKIKKKTYTTPKLSEFGSVKDFTQTITGASGNDGGTAPKNKVKTCISLAPIIEEHRFLIADEHCQNYFQTAIAATVKKGDVVLDLGTGSGIHAFFACQAGASKVYAIDSGPVIEVAKQAAIDNGFGEKIVFIRGSSSKIELPEKVDVIISHIGYLGSLNYMPEARRRFLKPGGKMIPNEIQNGFVPVEMPAYYDEHVGFWREKHFGLDFSAFRPLAVNAPHIRQGDDKEFLSHPQNAPAFSLFDDLKKTYRWHLEFESTRDGAMSGILGWYSFKLSDQVNVSTKPPLTLSRNIWNQPFLPLERPMALKKGDKIILDLAIFWEKGMEGPIWTWTVEVNGLRQQHSTFNGMPFIREALS